MKALSHLELAELADRYAAPLRSARKAGPAATTAYEPLVELLTILPHLSANDGRGSGGIDLAGSDNWFGVTLAVCRTYGDEAKEAYREWCKQSLRYDDDGFERAWAAHDPKHPNPVTKQSLYALARMHGWAGYSREPSTDRFKLLNGTALNALPPMEWRVKGLLPRKGIAAIYERM